MKINRFLLVGLGVGILGVLIAGFASPIFAHSPDGGNATPSNPEAWEEMHQACENGDYEAMDEGHTGYHGAEVPMNEGMMGGMH